MNTLSNSDVIRLYMECLELAKEHEFKIEFGWCGLKLSDNKIFYGDFELSELKNFLIGYSWGRRNHFEEAEEAKASFAGMHETQDQEFDEFLGDKYMKNNESTIMKTLRETRADMIEAPPLRYIREDRDITRQGFEEVEEKQPYPPTEHIFKTSEDCGCDGFSGCSICEGGLSICKVCGALEGALTTHCPGYQLSAEEIDLIYNGGKRDFRYGKWVDQPNPTHQIWNSVR